MLTYKIKDVLTALEEGEVDIVPQGCNCFCSFGKVLAQLIHNRFPLAWEADQQTVAGDRSKLGSFSFAEVLPGRFVVNCYTQFHWIKALNNEATIVKNNREVVLLADYEAIRQSLLAMSNRFSPDLRIGMPKIGAGLANGDWAIIENIVKETLIDRGFDVTFYVLDEKEIPERHV